MLDELKQLLSTDDVDKIVAHLDWMSDIFQSYAVGNIEIDGVVALLADWFKKETRPVVREAILDVLQDATFHPNFGAIGLDSLVECMECEDENTICAILEVLAYSRSEDHWEKIQRLEQHPSLRVRAAARASLLHAQRLSPPTSFKGD